jgi:hypothetical protein
MPLISGELVPGCSSRRQSCAAQIEWHFAGLGYSQCEKFQLKKRREKHLGQNWGRSQYKG